MKRIWRAGVVAALLVLINGVGIAQPPAGCSVDQQLAKLADNPGSKDSARPFKFIVLGDNQTPRHFKGPIMAGTMKPFQTEPFKQIIAEANILQPAFVVNVGDLILGYTAPEIIQASWDDYLSTIAASERPFISVSGNHDVFNTTAERIWLERMGPLYYSFNFGNSHFVVLNSQESEVQGKSDLCSFSVEQLAWLKADLEAQRNAQHIFVFLHKPFFAMPADKIGNWAEVHNLLKQYPVRAVFAGHQHRYCKFDLLDGIQYIVTGGAGTELFGLPKQGFFNHYLLVEVDGAKMHYAVVKPGAILSPEVVVEPLICK